MSSGGILLVVPMPLLIAALPCGLMVQAAAIARAA